MNQYNVLTYVYKEITSNDNVITYKYNENSNNCNINSYDWQKKIVVIPYIDELFLIVKKTNPCMNPSALNLAVLCMLER